MDDTDSEDGDQDSSSSLFQVFQQGGSDSRRFVYISASLAALNGLLFGFDTGVISGALPLIAETFGLSTFIQEVVVSVVLAGAAIGAATGGTLADRWGRRRVTMFGSVIFFISSLGMAFSPTVWWLIGFRLLVGFGIGIASIVGPLYISEIAPPKIRGSLGTLQQLAITLGILLAYFINYIFASLLQGPEAWRWMLGFGIVPAAILGFGMARLPESPRWLVRKDRDEEAHDVLTRIRTESSVDDELDEIQEIEEVQTRDLSTLLESWARPALIVGVGLAIFQQITGINTVLYYAPTILGSIGLGTLTAILATVGIGIVNVALTVVAVWQVDRLGRRPLLLISVGGMTVMLGIMGAIFYFTGLSGTIAWLAAASLALYVAFFAVGLGPIFWLMIAEIYPLQVRGVGEGAASVANWAANLIVTLTFLSLVHAIGRGFTFWLYGVVSVFAFLFIYSFVPETKGRSLEEIEADLRGTAFGDSEGGEAGEWTSEEDVG
jgi:sugar porter (SP) family MFS transporter